MASSSFTLSAPPIFSGENYQIWAFKMQSYLEAYDLWEEVEEEKQIRPLPANPTVAQMKHHSEEKAKKSKAKTLLLTSVADVIFPRLMTCKTPKEAWDKLKEEFQGSDKTKQMSVLNFKR